MEMPIEVPAAFFRGLTKRPFPDPPDMRKGRNMRSTTSWIVAILLALVISAAASGQVIVDGDLSDIKAVAQGDQGDPVNEICLLSKSGFDLRWVYVYYDEAQDKLFFGLDLMDVPDPDGGGGIGLSGPGVPGDADGDLNPHTATDPSCPVEEEQVAIGPDEMYLVKIDTNANGDFNEPEDIRLVYRGDLLRFERGDSTPLFDATGEAAVGTAGALVDPLLPNQNRLTEDIEFAVDNWSSLDPVPTCFIVTTFSGSLVDGFPEDELITPIEVQVASPAVNLTKEVRNTTQGGTYDDSTSVEIGDMVRFRLTLANEGNVSISPAIINDLLPFELDFVEGSVVGADTVETEVQGDGLLITMKRLSGNKELGVGDSRSVMFDAIVLNTISGAVVNTAEGGGLPPGECAEAGVSDTDNATVSVVDLECTKQVSLDGINYADSVQASVGQQVYFRVSLINPSSVDMTDAQIVDTLPAGLSNIVAPGCTIAGQTVTCDIGLLPAFATTSMDITATIDAGASSPLVNVADCSATFGTETLITSCEAEVELLAPAMICDKNVSHDGISWADNISGLTGQEVFFQVIVTNTGDQPLFEVTIDDTLPNGLGNVQIVSGASCSVSGQTVSCTNVGPLDPAESATIVYKATILASNPPVTTLMNVADCVGTPGEVGNPGEPINTQCGASVTLLAPCVVCDKEVSLDGTNYGPAVQTMPGEHVFFRITVSNCGDAPLENLVITDPIPAGLVNAATADGTCGIAGNVLTCNLASLAPGADWVVTFEADIDMNPASNPIVNVASISATPTADGQPGAEVTSDCSAEVSVGPLVIPTLTEWGILLLCSLLALSMILHHRLRL